MSIRPPAAFGFTLPGPGYMCFDANSDAFIMPALIRNVNMKVGGQRALVDPETGRFFIALRAMVICRPGTAGISTNAIVRIGSNGTFDNVCPLFTLTAPAALKAYQIPLAAADGVVINLNTATLSVDVQTPAQGTQFTADILLDGYMT